ncbi:DUF6443 domain-containing protein [Roseivirga sp. 4D4]|uniref:DUF6443 domain-containing protein n=1 Tax=Roseivirga sp. 4D4 TaxID=1889784 RepID=UPI00147AF4BD|nr:DUF6443 domain-containing protein [Roseivirga sp. 4D4]
MKTLTRFIQSLAVVVFLTTNLTAQNKPIPEFAPTQSVSLISHPGAYVNGHYINYVRSYDVLKPGLTESAILSSGQSPNNVLMTTQFMDGLGRHIQTVNRKASPNGLSDMVQAVTYDQFGRVKQTYLPYKSAGNDGVFRINPFTEQASFYTSHYGGDEDVFYGLTEFENSPLNRVTKQMAPGNSWAGSGKGVNHEWRTNLATDDVRLWTVIGSNNPSTSAEYAVGSLMVNITIDEENNHVKEFTDKLGRVVLKQVQKGTGTNNGHSDWLNTYYIYDNRGNLRYVLPPRAVELLSGSWSWNTTDMDALVFKYTYDGRNRMITKKVPGAGVVEMVYDRLDRLVATRDANMSTQGKWLFTKYDDLNRPVMTGFVISSNSRATMQTQADATSIFNVSTEPLNTSNVLEANSITLSAHVSGTAIYRSKTTIEFLPGFDSNGEYFETEINTSISSDYTFVQGYYDATFPSLKDHVHEVLSLSYFDSYHFTTQTYDVGYTDLYSAGTNNAVTPSQYTNVAGAATGSKVKVLGTTDEWLTTVMFYDDRGRVIQTQADNHVGGRDIATTQYDFRGKVLNTYTIHNNPNATPVQTTVAKRYTYDGSGTGRILTIQEKLNNTGSYKTISSNSYNDLGEIESKVLGNSLETLNYKYNIRGWLEGINEDYVANGSGGHYFGMNLSYDYGFTEKQLNGNVSGVRWRTSSSNKIRAYGFDYDRSNRLKEAEFFQIGGVFGNASYESSWTNSNRDFTTNYSYDANGNILNLTRKGVVAGSIETIDNLTYTYLNGGKSNQLLQVADAAGDLGQGDFVDGNSGTDYAYDSNGNMTQDLNKDINGGDITYNHLNLPERIEFSNNANKTITYTYDAAGTKLAKAVNNNGQITTTDYVSGFIYENNQLQHFANEEGRVRKNYQGNLVYDYFVKDHLGNTRMTLTEDQDVTVYFASMETEYESFEENLFLNMDNSRVVSTSGNYTVDGTINANEASRLNGSDAARRAGPGKLMAVSPGDNVDLEVWARYEGSFGSSSGLSQATMVTAVAATFGGVSGGGTEQQAIYDLFNGNGASVLVGSQGNSNEPRGYLNYILFDQDFNYIDAGFDQVTSVASGAHEKLTVPTLSISQGGYLYVYVSNESNTNFDVFFDDLRITHTKGAILQEDHYYPFGMNINALSSTAPLSKPNQFKLSGNEEQTEFDFNVYDFNARFYDDALGRFMNIDPMADLRNWVTPYNYVQNNPLILVDPTGLLEYRLNTETGELEQIGDKGGDERQFVKVGKRTVRVKGGKSDIHVGVVKKEAGEDGDVQYTASSKDLWSDVPEEYIGHYTAASLVERWNAANNPDKAIKIASIRDMESQGLARNEMIWNVGDMERHLVRKYGSKDAFNLAAETDMMPLPAGSVGGAAKNASSGISRFAQRRAALRGNGSLKTSSRNNVQVRMAGSGKLSKNSWIRFGQLNKGKFKGANGMARRRAAYNKWITGGG